jgi:osmotically-inducible protein OsmY
MLKRLGALTATLLLSASVAFAAVDKKDFKVISDIQKSVNRYSHFTIFDDVSARVDNGVVTLTGAVTMPYKKDDILKRVEKVDGVVKVQDRITVLPVSQYDDQLRYRIARAIYRNSSLHQYGIGANPPIHIVVEHGHVILAGVVNSDFDRTVAGTVAGSQFGVMSLKNDLKTDKEVKEALERP